MRIKVGQMHFKELSEWIKNSGESHLVLEECMGQRYIGSGLEGKHITIKGTPGNALGSYLNGCTIEVYGNAQDATGDTMNEGKIYIHGSSGDATGYSMRGGKIFVRDNAGYRAGIHMKAYKDKQPLLIVGGKVGNFLGEYQAGGTIIVLGLNCEEIPVGQLCGTGMHGGKIYLRSETLPLDLPKQVVARKAEAKDLQEIKDVIGEFCQVFQIEEEGVWHKNFYILEADTKNPYRQLYTHN